MEAARSFHEILWGRKAELENRIQSRDGVEIEPHAEAMDQALALSAREEAARNIDSCRLELRQVIEAIRRLHNGEYGICDYCGEAIARARLQAVPWAVRCTRCQEVAEEADGAEGERRG